MTFCTTGTITDELREEFPNVQREQISYAVRVLGIAPIARAGMTRVFPEQAVGQVRRFLEKRAARRAAK